MNAIKLRASLGLLLTTSALPFALACHSDEPPTGGKGEPTTPESGTQGGPASAPAEPIVHVPVGSFAAGSVPGDTGRDPSLETTRAEQKVGPFRIDALPRAVSQEPGAPSRTGVSADDAEALCARAGGRLCTEVEWERACKGPANSPYPGGDQPCKDEPCASGFDVRGMTTMLEWTASSFGKSSPESGKTVVRGAPKGASPDTRRCARRQAASKDTASEIGFRCCYGAPNAARLAEPSLGPPYREVDLSVEELGKLLELDESTKPLTRDLALFPERAVSVVFERGPGNDMGFTLTNRAVEWQPERGTRLLVAAGRSGERTAFVVAYYLAGDEKKLAGSFVMKNETGPIVLAYAPSIRPRMHFSGCWGCPGETGKLLFRPPEEIVLLQP